MGTSFENIHIFNENRQLSQERFPDCRISSLAENWLTLFPKNSSSFSQGYRLAGRISKEISCPVLWVSYFDDDMAELALFVEGKKACGCQVDDYRRIFLTKPKVWKDVLKLTVPEEKALREIVRCEESAAKTLDLLSHILGLPLFTAGMQKESHPAIPCRKEEGWAQSWLKRRQAINKVRNQTRMNLCSSLPGIHVHLEDDMKYGIIRIAPPDGKGSFQYRHICCYMIQDEAFVLVYSYWYPEELFGENDKSLWLDYFHKDILIMDKEHTGNGDGHLYWDKYITQLEEMISDKQQLYQHPLAREQKPDKFCYCCESQSAEYSSPRLVKKYPDGTECAHYLYEPDKGQKWFWGYGDMSLQITGSQIVTAAQKIYYGSTGEAACNIRFFDRELHLLREEEFTVHKIQDRMNHCFLYAPECDTIYYNGRSYDLSAHKLSRCIPPVEGNTVGFDKRGNMILLSGKSTVILLDKELRVLSRHRMKGTVCDIYQNPCGNYCFITVDENVYDWNIPDGNAAMRIYELSYHDV